MEKTLRKFAFWGFTWIIFAKMKCNWEVPTFPIGLQKYKYNLKKSIKVRRTCSKLKSIKTKNSHTNGFKKIDKKARKEAIDII